ncbi:hypothetical protein [Plasmodium yoelii yoelii]|uniref:Uncharacterized protein n=1 Tax=Plasmodium yoelii yoelii TaxID=73239 RepID=Q7RAM0_PLAYO|nr:hypothetical protein [Plasmodium yoelii yoelii]
MCVMYSYKKQHRGVVYNCKRVSILSGPFMILMYKSVICILYKLVFEISTIAKIILSFMCVYRILPPKK